MRETAKKQNETDVLRLKLAKTNAAFCDGIVCIVQRHPGELEGCYILQYLGFVLVAYALASSVSLPDPKHLYDNPGSYYGCRVYHRRPQYT